MLPAVVTLVFLSGALGQITLEGSCNFTTVSGTQNLNVTAMLGQWYQIQRINNSVEHGDCSTTNFELNSNSQYTITNREVHHKTEETRKGIVTILDENTGVFVMNFTDIVYNSKILVADYEKFTLIYSCRNQDNTSKSVSAWVYSRTKDVDVASKITIEAAIFRNSDIRNASWLNVQHSSEACQVNSSINYKLSPLLAILALLVMAKECI